MLVRSRVLKMLTTLIGTTQLFDVTVENIKLLIKGHDAECAYRSRAFRSLSELHGR